MDALRSIWSGNVDSKRVLFWAAALSVADGLAHGAATAEHLSEWWGYGAFFIMAAIVQVIYGVVLFIQPWRYDETGGTYADPEPYGRPWYLVAIAGNAAIILLWVITRTVGIPFLGPAAGEVEAVTLLSVVAKVIELGIIACLAALVRAIDARQVASA